MDAKLLVIDVGNTQTVLGLYQKEKLMAHWRVSTGRERTSDEMGVLVNNLFAARGLSMDRVKGVIISSVVPPLNHSLERFCLNYLGEKPLFVGPGIKSGMPILYENPRELGSDRISNAVAAFDRFGGACIVVDFGTATKFECVSAKGEYLGGAISPGVIISAEALARRASKLPWVELFQPPKSAIGKSTAASMNSGIVLGFAAMVDGMVQAMKDKFDSKARVAATGGLAGIIAGHCKRVDEVVENLTLEGLRIIYGRNK